MLINIEKHVSLPTTLKANTMYLLKNGAYFDMYLTNSSGTIITYPSRRTIPANSIPANNSSSVATPGDSIVYKDSGELTLTSTITFTGTTAPSGTASNSYQWNQVGKLVTLRVSLSYVTNGVAITVLTFDLPADMPLPPAISGFGNSAAILYVGNAMMATTVAANSNVNSRSLIVKSTTSASGYIVAIRHAAGNVDMRAAWITIQYFTA